MLEHHQDLAAERFVKHRKRAPQVVAAAGTNEREVLAAARTTEAAAAAADVTTIRGHISSASSCARRCHPCERERVLQRRRWTLTLPRRSRLFSLPVITEGGTVGRVWISPSVVTCASLTVLSPRLPRAPSSRRVVDLEHGAPRHGTLLLTPGGPRSYASQ